jgi:hypothetical protein
LKALEVDVSELCREISAADGDDCAVASSTQQHTNTNSADSTSSLEVRVVDLERRVAGRFTVIWSVFRAHSAAEDEFIWPALKAKQVALPEGCSPCGSPRHANDSGGSEENVSLRMVHEPQQENGAGAEVADGNLQPQLGDGEQQRDRAHSVTVHCIEQEEYEEDHADEERMFNSINDMLSNLREELSKRRKNGNATADANNKKGSSSLRRVAEMLLEGTGNLMRHLMTHLDKEETHCMPLVAQYLTKAEINDLVGKIMGKRSSELMSQILTMAVQNLNDADRDDMVRYMKQAMVGTFFERWLKMGGWISSSALNSSGVESGESDDGGGKMPHKKTISEAVTTNSSYREDSKHVSISESKKPEPSTTTSTLAEAAVEKAKSIPAPQSSYSNASSASAQNVAAGPSEGTPETYTSAVELEKLIRAIGTNPNLDTKQKNLTIQGLRDSVWKSNCRMSKRKREDGVVSVDQPPAQLAHVAVTASANNVAATRSQSSPGSQATVAAHPHQTHHMRYAYCGMMRGLAALLPLSNTYSPSTDISHSFSVATGVGTRFKRETPPSSYYKKTKDGEVRLVWSSDPRSAMFHPNDGSVPLFSASELAPTYHDGGINRVLGCPHYARSCKLRHPTSGRLYTCRLCCEQTREMDTQDKDSPLDRYEVKEILCMRCGALQPAGDKCVNTECESRGKPFARYTCKICNFYDDSPNKAIYHCPFCNVCRSGQGLGIDYRHCMRCNACVSLTDDHNCIPQRLQGNCPICHETMFESTEPLRGLKCGHVMHLPCFTMYMRGQNYTCPLCKKSADDMKEYFALLDSAVRMQPMPPAYAATTSNIYCQDCGKMGNVSYHFVGLKCGHCESYNTRELQRVDANIMASLWQGY